MSQKNLCEHVPVFPRDHLHVGSSDEYLRKTTRLKIRRCDGIEYAFCVSRSAVQWNASVRG